MDVEQVVTVRQLAVLLLSYESFTPGTLSSVLNAAPYPKSGSPGAPQNMLSLWKFADSNHSFCRQSVNQPPVISEVLLRDMVIFWSDWISYSCKTLTSLLFTLTPVYPEKHTCTREELKLYWAVVHWASPTHQVSTLGSALKNSEVLTAPWAESALNLTISWWQLVLPNLWQRMTEFQNWEGSWGHLV